MNWGGQMSYQERIKSVIDFISQHLDEDLTLEQLSNIACFSKYHFHRLFTAYTGLSLQQYIRWLRINRAAQQLLVDKHRPVLDIAFESGFESQAAFSRVFKQIIGISPKQFRDRSYKLLVDKPYYRLPKFKESFMQIEIRNEQSRRLAAVEHRGDPQTLPKSVMKLITWAKAQHISLKPKPGEAFGIAYDDPDVANKDEFRFDLAIVAADSIVIDPKSGLVEKILPAGRYATFMHKGARRDIGAKIYAFFRDWLPNSGEQMGELPCIFCYHNLDTEVTEDELLTECWFYLQD